MAKYISVAQAAKHLGVSTETIYNYCRQGLLGGQYIKIRQKGTWRVDIESLELLEKDSIFKSTYQIKKNKEFNLF